MAVLTGLGIEKYVAGVLAVAIWLLVAGTEIIPPKSACGVKAANFRISLGLMVRPERFELPTY